MTKVLLLFSSSQLGGAEKSLSRMAFASRDIKYTLGTLDSEGPWSEWLISKGFKPLMYGNYNKISLIIKLYRDIKSLNFDAVYVCGLRASFLLRFVLILISKTKLIHGVRWNPSTKTPLDISFRIVEKYLSWLVDGWIVNSEMTQNTLIERCGINKNKIFLVYNGIQIPSKTMSPSEEDIEILTIANLNKRKGYLEYLKIISKIIDLVPDIKFVFVGRDEMNGAVQRKIIEYGLENHITYEGFQANTAQYYNRAHLFILPSLWGEGCPTSILESSSFAVPVIAYNIDGIPELVKSGDDGLLLDLADEDGYKKIIEILKNKQALSIMGKNGRSKIKNAFTIDACVENHKIAVTSILETN